MINLLKSPLIRYLYWLSKVLLLKLKGKSLTLDYLASFSNCSFGENVYIGSNSVVSNCSMGSFTYMSHSCFVYNTKIGKYSSIGPDVKIVLGTHPINKYVSTHPLFYSSVHPPIRIHFLKESKFEEVLNVTIGNDVFIGANCIILDGIYVGDGAVIAAGAVVTKNVKPYEIVGGIPAKHIKYRFSTDIINFLLEFKWWDKDIEWIKGNMVLMQNIEELYRKYGSTS